LAVRIPGLGKVRLVVSFKSAELTGTYVILVTIGRTGVPTDHHPVSATLANRNLYQDGKTSLASTSIACAALNHWETLVSGVW